MRTAFPELNDLMLTAQRLVRGLYSGMHASVWRGSGAEFHDFRAYVPGDDAREVDWKLFGRCDRLYIRRHRQHTHTDVAIVVDASASMAFAGIDAPNAASKFDTARLLAAALGYLTIHQGDRAGLVVYHQAGAQTLPASGTPGQLTHLGEALQCARPVGVGNVHQALVAAGALLPRGGVVVLISDLLDDPAPLSIGLNRLMQARHELLVLQCVHPQELDLARVPGEERSLIDPESPVRVNTDVPLTAGAYRETVSRHLDAVRRVCLSRHADHELIVTDQPLLSALRRVLVKRSRRRM